MIVNTIKKQLEMGHSEKLLQLLLIQLKNNRIRGCYTRTPTYLNSCSLQWALGNRCRFSDQGRLSMI